MLFYTELGSEELKLHINYTLLLLNMPIENVNANKFLKSGVRKSLTHPLLQTKPVFGKGIMVRIFGLLVLSKPHFFASRRHKLVVLIPSPAKNSVLSLFYLLQFALHTLIMEIWSYWGNGVLLLVMLLFFYQLNLQFLTIFSEDLEQTDEESERKINGCSNQQNFCCF